VPLFTVQRFSPVSVLLAVKNSFPVVSTDVRKLDYKLEVARKRKPRRQAVSSVEEGNHHPEPCNRDRVTTLRLSTGVSGN
jgi:hypothetical protein